jgi:PhnB protein
MSLNPYLYFDGQCEEAFKFYAKRLGGKINFMMTWEGASMVGQAPPGWAKKILHAGLALGDGVLEGCDAMPGEYKKPQSFCVMFRPKDAMQADRIFSALAEDGAVEIPIAETFWALRWMRTAACGPAIVDVAWSPEKKTRVAERRWETPVIVGR